jgi:hypothetical protein
VSSACGADGGDDDDDDDHCTNIQSRACPGTSDDGQSSVGSESADDDERADDDAADDDAADDESASNGDETDAGDGSNGGDAESTGRDSEGGTTGDPCAGLDQDACAAQAQLGNCTPVWGVPWIDMQGEWCLFPNGTEYLGCAVQAGCGDAEGTVCDPASMAWNVTTTCLPADRELAACDPPGDCVY